MGPDRSYEHRLLQVAQSAGPPGLTELMDQSSLEGWETFQVLPTQRRDHATGQAEPVFHVLQRRPRVRLILPGQRGPLPGEEGTYCTN